VQTGQASLDYDSASGNGPQSEMYVLDMKFAEGRSQIATGK
jgi:hypothetical protein